MRKKIKLIFLSIGLSIVLIAGIIELGKILNVVSTQETSQGFKEAQVKAAPLLTHTEGSLEGAPCGQMYNFAPGYYCARHEWEIARHMSHDASTVVISDPVGVSNRAQEIKYKYEKTTEMTQTLAYAQNYTVDGNKTSNYEMQRIVWGSWQFKAYTGGDCGLIEDVADDGTWNTASDGMIGRSYQFANFIYKALDDKGHLNMTCTPLADEDDNLRIMVDQTALQYTVGPYVLNFERQEEGCVEGTGNELMKDLVYNEIMERNQGWSEDNKFCAGKVQALITYEDNTHELKEIGVEILDASGNPIADNFPRFGETFYLRYKTTLDEDIRYIRPSIEISHLKKMTNNGRNYEVWTYKSQHIKYSMITDQGGLFEESLKEISHTLGGYNATVRAYIRDGRWCVYFNYPMDIIKGDLSDRVKNMIDIVFPALERMIREKGADWGLNNVKVTFDRTPCVLWLDEYFTNPGCQITSKLIDITWKRDVYDATTGIFDTETQNGLSRPNGQGWRNDEELWEATVSGALENDVMKNLRTTGKSADEAMESLQGVIDGKGGVCLAFILDELIVDEDILESQPNEKLEIVVPPAVWIEKKITIREILEERHIEDGGEYYGKEKLAGNTLLEEQDWAVENITLPRKRN